MYNFILTERRHGMYRGFTRGSRTTLLPYEEAGVLDAPGDAGGGDEAGDEPVMVASNALYCCSQNVLIMSCFICKVHTRSL